MLINKKYILYIYEYILNTKSIYHVLRLSFQGGTIVNKAKLMPILAIGIAIAVLTAGCLSKNDNNQETKTIVVKGSDTMVILAQSWAEEYLTKNKSVKIAVTGGGSGTGIAALIDKNTDIAVSSREIKQDEIDKAKANGVNPYSIKVAFDGIAVIVHSSNKINNLTVEQLRGIFNGTIKNWKDVGGEDKTIKVYSRESNSGTYLFFKEHVLKEGDYRADAMLMSGSSALVQAVSQDINGIGYTGVAYVLNAEGIKILSVAKDSTSSAYQPTKDNVLSNKYDLGRPLYCITNGKPTGAIKEYIRWILSEEGQKIVEEIGYYKLTDDIINEQKTDIEKG